MSHCNNHRFIIVFNIQTINYGVIGYVATTSPKKILISSFLGTDSRVLLVLGDQAIFTGLFFCLWLASFTIGLGLCIHCPFSYSCDCLSDGQLPPQQASCYWSLSYSWLPNLSYWQIRHTLHFWHYPYEDCYYVLNHFASFIQESFECVTYVFIW